MKASIVVPTYNEKENIGLLVERIDEALRDQSYEIIVVDDNSPDGTAEAAIDLGKDYPITVIRRKGVRGLGSAILTGFRNATGDIIGVIDADLQDCSLRATKRSPSGHTDFGDCLSHISIHSAGPATCNNIH